MLVCGVHSCFLFVAIVFRRQIWLVWHVIQSKHFKTLPFIFVEKIETWSILAIFGHVWLLSAYLKILRDHVKNFT